jgi:hypothetical protein
MQNIYDRLSEYGKNAFNTGADFADAKARFDYINAWVSLQSVEPLGHLNDTLTNSIFIIVSIMGIGGLALYLAYRYKLRLKK